VILKVTDEGLTPNEEEGVDVDGGAVGVGVGVATAATFKTTPIVAGPPLRAFPPFAAATEIVPLYFPAASPAVFACTVNVPLPPLVIVFVPGETFSQPFPALRATFGV